MMRKISFLVILAGILPAAFALSDHWRWTTLDAAAIRLNNGGNPGDARCTIRCDLGSNQFDDCIIAGDYCQQCGQNVNGAFLATTYDYTGAAGALGCGNVGGFMYLNNGQTYNCGTLYAGTCAASATSPTGLQCVLNNVGAACLLGKRLVVPQ